MKNIFKFSFVAMTIAAFMTSCNQNDDPISMPDHGNALVVTVNASDFAPADAATRITTGSDYKTVFQKDDEIGVYAFVTNGSSTEVVCKNTSLKLNDQGNWDGTLYKYEGATYIAYSPYNKDFSAMSISSEKDIIDLVAAMVGEAKDQSNIEMFNSLDLMTATGEEGTDNAITFNFAHKMSMVELVVPVAKFRTLDDANAADCYHYTAPVEVELTLTSTAAPASDDGTSLKPCSMGNGVYRYILAPGSDISASGTLYYRFSEDGTQKVPVTFTTEASGVLEAGNYKGWNVTYTGVSANEVVRPIAIGDYYYADGSIFPVGYGNFGENPLTGGCIGIIYSTETTDAEKNAGFTHGQVLALTEATTAGCNWTTLSSFSSAIPTFVTKQQNSSAPTDISGDTDILANMFANKNGYAITKAVMAIEGAATSYPAFNAAVNYGTGETASYAPQKDMTTGWYLPAMGQIVDMFNNLGVIPTVGGANADYRLDASHAWRGTDDVTKPALKRLYDKLASVNGTLNIDPNGSNTSINRMWWTSVGHSGKEGWTVEMNCVKFVVLTRNNNAPFVRPVLAF